MDCVIEIVKCVCGPIVKFIKDQIKFNDSLEEFKRRKVDLTNRKHDIDARLNTQLRYGKVARQEVQSWLNDAEKFITRPAVEDEVNSRGCLSCCYRVKILEERVKELKEICDRGGNYTNECLVNDDPSASVVELRASELQGSEAVKANILECLKGDEVTMLGVWGMGGVGKTTIMMHVHNELLKEGKFKKIIWVDVSQNFDIRKLQEQIACSLKEKLEELPNATNRAGVLSKMLEKQKPYLLILDDVWRSFRLEDVGIPEPRVADGCKLVLTTRSQEIARSMGCKGFKVETLSREEALKLFLNKVGDTVALKLFLNEVGDTVLSCHEVGIKKDLASILKKIVAECDGLPLAIVTVAGSLKEISEPWSWSLALDQLRDCKRNVVGTDADTFQILKFSYDRLSHQQIQYCFLYCALYPEDYKIPKEEIIENWIDEGFVDERDSQQSMKYKGYGTLMKLVDNSLLELIEDEVRGDCVRMHDLIRDMALHITRTSPRFLVEAGKSLKELPEKVECTEDIEKVSLMHNYIEEIPLGMASSICIRLTTLLLAHNRLSTIPESVFEHMLELNILDLSFNQQLSSLPNSVSKLVKLTTLLLESTSLEKVPSLSGLGSLKKLNLRETKMKEVPDGLGMLKNLKCLFLCGLNEDRVLEIDEIADGVLSNLSKLQELSLDRSRIKLKGDVVGRLKKLEVFHGWFPTANEMKIFLNCQPNRLSDYFIAVGSKLATMSMTGYFCRGKERPRYKKVVVFKETSIVGENVLFPSIQILGIVACHDIRSLNDFCTINDATDLRECWIKNCEGMECIFPSWINNPVVQTLEYLRLDELHKLDGLFEANVMVTSSPPPGTFSSLKEVEIFSCKKVKKLFPSWKLAEYLQSLESFHVSYCEEMEEIIGSDPEEEGEGGDIIKKLILPKLKMLSLWQLPALKSICSRRAVMVCDSLKYITIFNCKGLRRIPLCLFSHLSLYGLDNLDWLFEAELIAMSPPQCCTFSFLKEVVILDCKKIKKLFPSWKLVEYLQSLEKIWVRNCEEMEEIIASDPEEEGEGGRHMIKKLILPKLKELELQRLPVLKSICSRRIVMVCDSLGEIEIKDCKGLRRIPLCLFSRLSLDGLDNLDWVFEAELIAMSPTQPHTFSFLKEVVILDCKKIKKLFPSWKLVEYLQSLEEIRVSKCEEMEEIIASDPEEGEGGDMIKKLILPKLKELELQFLPALKSVYSRRAVMVCDSLKEIFIRDCKVLRRSPFCLPHRLYLEELDNLDWVFEAELIAMSPAQRCTFSFLKEVVILDCKKIKKLFPSWKLVEYLQSLEKIWVRNCEEIEEIIASDSEEGGGGGRDMIKKLILPKLKELELQRLPVLKSICSRRAVMVCDSLREIEIRDCKGLRRIPLCLFSRLSLDGLDNLDWVFEAELIAMSLAQPHTFSFLKEVVILDCKKIKKLFPSWKLVEYLQSLEEIRVNKCEEMEEIIASDPEEEGEGRDMIKKLILPKLKYLRLEHLSALKSICSRRAVMVSDSLEDIEITDCKGLRRISFCLPPNLSLGELDCLDWVFEVELIAMSPPQHSTFLSLKKINIKKCKRAKKLFPSWKLMEYLQSLEEIWVEDCEEMEEIIGSDLEEGGDNIKKLILPKLKMLSLWQLPALKSICSRRAVMVCDSLEEIFINDCKGLRRIPFCLPPRLSLGELDCLDWVFEVELITMSPPQPCTFSFLKEVVVWGCEKIKKLFPSWKFLKYLQSLEYIWVRDCEEVEEIIGSNPEDEGEEGGDIIKKLILPKLKYLRLDGLPTLKSICSRTSVMVCDSLEYIDIWHCKGLRRIPLSLPLVDNAQPSPPPFLEVISLDSEEWWELLEWDQPNAKDVLRPMVVFEDRSSSELERSESEQLELE